MSGVMPSMLKPRVYEESRPDLTSVSTLAAEGTLTWLGLGMGLGLEVGIWPHAITSLTRHRPHLALGEPRPVKLADVVGDAVSRAVERERLHEQHTEQQHGPHLQA